MTDRPKAMYDQRRKSVERLVQAMVTSKALGQDPESRFLADQLESDRNDLDETALLDRLARDELARSFGF